MEENSLVYQKMWKIKEINNVRSKTIVDIFNYDTIQSNGLFIELFPCYDSKRILISNRAFKFGLLNCLFRG